MADEYDPSDPPTFDPQEEAYDPAGYTAFDLQDEGEEDDDYDPSNFNAGDKSDHETPEENAPLNRQSPPQPEMPQKPKTLGGFVLEESDDEQEGQDSPPSQLNSSTGAESGLGAVAASEAQDVSLRSVPQDNAASSTSLNGSTTIPVPASTLSPSSLSPQHALEEQRRTLSPTSSAAQASNVATHPPPSKIANSIAPTPTPADQLNGSAVPAQMRLPHDKVGHLEDRIKDDPKGDINAWEKLISHYYDKGQYDFARNVYNRFFKVFPTATSMWIKYLQMENELDERNRVELIFNECLMQLSSLDMWSLYLDHLRRVLPLINDVGGKNRGTISSAFEVVLEQVGIDPNAGNLWREYIEFLKDGPGTVGGSSWQDAQKVDHLRKGYQRAFKIPHSEFVKIWKEYETFEMSLHKATGRKHIQEQSPHYMQCRTAKVQLDQKLDGLDRKSLPRLPPLYDCAGEDEFAFQVEKWRAWINWEKEDPLVFQGEDDAEYRKRILFAYKQATMSLAFYPQIWFEAASWCFAQGTDQVSTEGEQLLDKGISANPESVLLAMMKADRIESSLETGNTDEVLIRNGDKLDEPYENVHTALYALRTKVTEKDKRAVAQIQEHFAAFPPEDEHTKADEDGDDNEGPGDEKPMNREEQIRAQIDSVKKASAAQLDTLKRMISYIWVAKMRAFRRVQGQGKPQKKGEAPKQTVKGFRGVFSDARPRGPLSSDVYIASALMEWQCYRDPSAIKIFERGMKLFPTDEFFILEYIKHLIADNDVTNARVVFESTIPKLTNSSDFTLDQQREKCRPLFDFMLDYESKYGDLAQIHKLERRMADLYPEELDVSRFSNRFALPSFDAMHAQIIISPTQAQPKDPSSQLEAPQQPTVTVKEVNTPKGPEILLGPNGPYVASPKRPLEDSDTESPQRKYFRPESPLKGAAGARMQGKTGAGQSGGGFSTKTYIPPNALGPMGATVGPPMLPPQIEAVLRMLPNAATYNSTRLDAARLVVFLPSINIEHARALHNAGQLMRR